MKNTKICPKCNSSNIVRVDGCADNYGRGNQVVVSMFTAVNVHRYICCDCGFTEEWIDKQDLGEVGNSKKVKRI